ncbi:MAG: hypothetical protein ACO1OK_09095 [Devosia sp.]
MRSITAAGRRLFEGHAYNLGVITLAIALGGIGLAYAIDGAVRHIADPVPASETRMFARTIAGRTLTIPSVWFRTEEVASGDFSRQVDLSVMLPLGAEGSPMRVDVSLMPRSAVRPSAGLLDGVYLHMFQPQQVSGPPGLIGKPLRNMDGYSGETVWYDALSAEPFVAKCMVPVAEGAPAQCLRAVYLKTGIAAVYSFDQSLLWAWRDFDAEMSEKLRAIGAL